LNPGAGAKQLANRRGCARHFRRRFKRLAWHWYPRKAVLAFCDAASRPNRLAAAIERI
jgi:hypothetical protein